MFIIIILLIQWGNKHIEAYACSVFFSFIIWSRVWEWYNAINYMFY